MNKRDNLPKTTRLNKAALLNIKMEFRNNGYTEEQAETFCEIAEMKIRNLMPCLKSENSYCGEKGTTEKAKNELKLLADRISYFMSLKGAYGTIANGLLQVGWVQLDFPLKYDCTPWDMLDMLKNAAYEGTKIKSRRGKLPVSQAEITMWSSIAKAFTDITKKKPTASPSAIFSNIASYIAADVGIDEPSRAVLEPAIKNI